MPLFKRRSSPSVHWSKDFIEHLRTVHFTLVVLAVLAIISGRAPDVAKMRTAKTQLTTIRDFLEEKLPKEAAADKDLDSEAGTGTWILLSSKKIAARFPYGMRAFNGVCTASSDKPLTLAELFEWSGRTQPSLMDFRRIWDAINCSKVQDYDTEDIGEMYAGNWEELYASGRASEVLPSSITTGGRSDLEKKGFKFGSLRAVAVGEDSKAIPDTFFQALRFRNRSSEADRGSVVFYEMTYPSGAPVGVIVGFVPVLVHVSDSGVGHDFLTHLESTWDCRDEYAKCFSELREVAQDREHFSLKDLSKWLDDEIMSAEPSRIDIFGIRFPADSQFQWGIILILTVLLYFWMHLRELSPRLKANHSGLEVAWPGLYRSWIAYAVMWTTVVFVPLYALWILGLNRIHYKSPWQTFVVSTWRDVAMWLALPLIIYSVLSVWSCLKLRRLALLADAARQVAECEPSKEETAAARASAE